MCHYILWSDGTKLGESWDGFGSKDESNQKKR